MSQEEILGIPLEEHMTSLKHIAHCEDQLFKQIHCLQGMSKCGTNPYEEQALEGAEERPKVNSSPRAGLIRLKVRR